MRKMLENFKAKNKFYPNYILVYRDGVSEEFNELAEREILSMKKTFEEISKETGKKYEPIITFIVVQKR